MGQRLSAHLLSLVRLILNCGAMKIQINNSAYKRLDTVSNEEKVLDRAKIQFIVPVNLEKTGRRFLGCAWMVLDPLI